MFTLWLQFVVCAAVVVFSGYRICVYGEEIAQILKMGRSFVGFMILAVITSLPELGVTVSATKIGALNLAIGDLFGSNLFNLTIIAVIYLAFIKKSELLNFEPVHFISSGFSVLLITLAAMGIAFYNFVHHAVNYSRIFLDVETVLILLGYIFGAYLIFNTEKAKMKTASIFKPEPPRQRKKVWFKFLFYSAVLIASAMYLSRLGNRIARIPVQGVPLGGTFVGGLFMAVVTSLPEVSVAISAVKLGFLDMALGNIFGSNMFNMGIIPITDLVLGRKIILSDVSALHLFTAFFVVISTILVISSLVWRSHKKTAPLAWDSVSIIFVYFSAMLVNFYLR